MSLRKIIKNYLSNVGPNFVAATASQITEGITPIGIRRSQIIRQKLPSVSSIIRKMVKDGELEVVKNFGPRNGNGYKIKVDA